MGDESSPRSDQTGEEKGVVQYDTPRGQITLTIQIVRRFFCPKATELEALITDASEALYRWNKNLGPGHAVEAYHKLTDEVARIENQEGGERESGGEATSLNAPGAAVELPPEGTPTAAANPAAQFERKEGKLTCKLCGMSPPNHLLGVNGSVFYCRKPGAKV